MDRARFRNQLETLCSRSESLLQAAATGSHPPDDLALGAVEALNASITAMELVDDELARLDRELGDACRRADVERRRYHDLFMTTAEADVLTDDRATIAEANLAAAELLGTPLSQLTGKPLPLFVASRDRARFYATLRRARTGRARVAPRAPLLCQTIRRDRRFRCRIAVERIAGAQACEPTFRWSLRDQSDRERAARCDALVEQATRKDEFLAVLGHELRNPLAALTLASDILRGDLQRRDLIRSREIVDIIGRHAQQLGRLVDDLLDVARVCHGKIELRCGPVELSDVVARAIETVQPVVREKRQQIEVSLPSAPLWVRGDCVRLQQVAANLLHNAAKYSPAGGRIEVALRSSDAVGLLSVRDHGQGIPPHMLDTIFGLFEQAEVRGAAPGLGLGLSLVRELVLLHGGEVRALSQGPGHGSEFIVSLPLVPIAEIQPEESARLVAAGQPVTVLVADDNVDAAEILGLTLQQLGHDVVVATSGSEAIERAAERPVSVALLDLDMPDIDGFEVARRLRANRPDVRLVAVTGFSDERSRQRAVMAGFEHYLLKPLDLPTVDALLRRGDRGG
jgi:PAS domain S-box-containing protein